MTHSAIIAAAASIIPEVMRELTFADYNIGASRMDHLRAASLLLSKALESVQDAIIDQIETDRSDNRR